jgi:ATP-dependent 26S proteasome regulatory subunit
MKPVMVIGATNRPDALDSALRRAGRFDREILMGVPDEAARLSILRVLTSRLRLAGDFNLEELARRTPGYVGMQCVGMQCVGMQCVGMQCVGMQCVGMQCVGMQCVGMQCVGMQCVGMQC